MKVLELDVVISLVILYINTYGPASAQDDTKGEYSV